jgi:hypothetical protein
VPHYFFFAVLAACLNDLEDGAPLVPGFRIFSPEPAAILFFFAAMFAYNPLLAITISLTWCLSTSNAAETISAVSLGLQPPSGSSSSDRQI